MENFQEILNKRVKEAKVNLTDPNYIEGMFEERKIYFDAALEEAVEGIWDDLGLPRTSPRDDMEYLNNADFADIQYVNTFCHKNNCLVPIAYTKANGDKQMLIMAYDSLCKYVGKLLK